MNQPVMKFLRTLFMFAATVMCATAYGTPLPENQTAQNAASASPPTLSNDIPPGCRGLKPVDSVEDILYQIYQNKDTNCIFVIHPKVLQRIWHVPVGDARKNPPKYNINSSKYSKDSLSFEEIPKLLKYHYLVFGEQGRYLSPFSLFDSVENYAGNKKVPNQDRQELLIGQVIPKEVLSEKQANMWTRRIIFQSPESFPPKLPKPDSRYKYNSVITHILPGLSVDEQPREIDKGYGDYRAHHVYFWRGKYLNIYLYRRPNYPVLYIYVTNYEINF